MGSIGKMPYSLRVHSNSLKGVTDITKVTIEYINASSCPMHSTRPFCCSHPKPVAACRYGVKEQKPLEKVTMFSRLHDAPFYDTLLRYYYFEEGGG